MNGSANSLQVLAAIGVGGAQNVLGPSTALASGTWFFAAVTYNSGGLHRFYVLNSDLTQNQLFTADGNIGSIQYDTSKFWVGGATGSGFLNGDIGSVILTGTHATGLTDVQNYAKCVAANFPASATFDAGYCSPSSLADLSGNNASFTTLGTPTVGGTPPNTLCSAPAPVTPAGSIWTYNHGGI